MELKSALILFDDSQGMCDRVTFSDKMFVRNCGKRGEKGKEESIQRL